MKNGTYSKQVKILFKNSNSFLDSCCMIFNIDVNSRQAVQNSTAVC